MGSFEHCSLRKNAQWSSAWLKGRPSATIFKETLQWKALIDFRGHWNDMPSCFTTSCSDTLVYSGWNKSTSPWHIFVESKYYALAFSLVFCVLTSMVYTQILCECRCSGGMDCNCVSDLLLTPPVPALWTPGETLEEVLSSILNVVFFIIMVLYDKPVETNA